MAKGTGRGICPIMSNGQGVATPCKGEKCQLWNEDSEQCSQNAIGTLYSISDELIEIRRFLSILVKGEMSDRNDP